jgi:membrane-associated phospholipid phosphatase
MRIIVVLSAILFFLTATCNVFASQAVKTAGDVVAVAVPAAALAIALTPPSDKDGVLQFVEAYGTAAAVTYGLKYSINERRPNGEKHSFPSFHASSTFAAATFIEKRYGGVLGIAAYLASGFVGWSRIESREHWAKDVFAGAAIGIASGYIFTKPYKGFVVSPVAGNGLWGLSIAKTF